MSAPIPELRNTIILVLRQLNSSPSLLGAVKLLDDESIKDFIEGVDESHYSLQEWCEALMEFEKWERANDRALTLSYKIEYLSCCVEGTQNEGKLLTLKDVWLNYVTNYGVL